MTESRHPHTSTTQINKAKGIFNQSPLNLKKQVMLQDRSRKFYSPQDIKVNFKELDRVNKDSRAMPPIENHWPRHKITDFKEIIREKYSRQVAPSRPGPDLKVLSQLEQNKENNQLYQTQKATNWQSFSNTKTPLPSKRKAFLCQTQSHFPNKERSVRKDSSDAFPEEIDSYTKMKETFQRRCKEIESIDNKMHQEIEQNQIEQAQVMKKINVFYNSDVMNDSNVYYTNSMAQAVLGKERSDRKTVQEIFKSFNQKSWQTHHSYIKSLSMPKPVSPQQRLALFLLQKVMGNRERLSREHLFEQLLRLEA